MKAEKYLADFVKKVFEKPPVGAMGDYHIEIWEHGTIWALFDHDGKQYGLWLSETGGLQNTEFYIVDERHDWRGYKPITGKQWVAIRGIFQDSVLLDERIKAAKARKTAEAEAYNRFLDERGISVRDRLNMGLFE